MPASGFVKEVFRPGIYQKGGIEYRITRDHVAAFFDGLKKLDRAGYDVPLHFEHPSGDKAAPVPKTEWDKRADLVRNTAGKALVNHPSSRINDRGALELAFSVSDKAAKRLIKNQEIGFVSPEIRTSFTDGMGRDFGPVISHVALTHTPVQADQAKGFSRVQLSDVGDEPFQVSLAELKKGAKAKPIRIVQLSVAQNAADGPDTTAQDDGSDNPDMPQNPADKKKLQALIGHCAQAGLPLPSDTNNDNLVDRLLTAFMVFNAAKQREEEAEADDDDQGVEEAMPPTISQFSLAEISEQIAARNKRVDKLADDKLLSPGQRDYIRNLLGKTQFSQDGAASFELIDSVLDMFEKGPKLQLDVQLSDTGTPEHPGGDAWMHGDEAIKLGDPRAKEAAAAFLERTGPKRKTA